MVGAGGAGPLSTRTLIFRKTTLCVCDREARADC